jgi:hypothetical protein
LKEKQKSLLKDLTQFRTSDTVVNRWKARPGGRVLENLPVNIVGSKARRRSPGKSSYEYDPLV